MKKLITILLFFIVVSCGKQEARTDASLIITSASSISAANGGLIILGKHLEEEDSFIVKVDDITKEISLKNGNWRFAAISWEDQNGDGVFTGNNRCATTPIVDVQPPEVNIAISLTDTDCTIVDDFYDDITGDQYHSVGTGQFKTLDITSCHEVNALGTGCAASGGTIAVTNSVEVILLMEQELEGVVSVQEFKTSCYSGFTTVGDLKTITTNLKFPSLSSAGDTVLKPIFLFHESADCSDASPVVNRFESGLFQREDTPINDIGGIGDISIGADVITVFIEHPATAPIAASALDWSTGTPGYSNAATLTANWAVGFSPIAGVASQEVTLYSDISCTSIVSGPTLLSAVTNSETFVGSDGINYYFNVKTTFDDSSEVLSPCSIGIIVDITPPAAPIATSWLETSPANSGPATAQWNTSISGDVNTQSIEYFTDISCISSHSLSAGLPSGVTSDNSIPLSDGEYYYMVTAVDFAGNSSSSVCSPTAFVFDTTAPTFASSLTWSEGATHSLGVSTDINASWVPAADGDIDTQTIDIYTDPSCTAGIVESNTGLSSIANTFNFTSPIDGNTYYFRIRSEDFAGNISVDACSIGITVSP